MIKLVIFDMDGVLVDACEWHRIALNEALKEVCNYEISLEEHYKTFNGIPTKVKLQKLSEMNIVEKKLFEKIENIKQEKTIEAIQKYAFPREEKISLMKFLKEKNIKIACCTNSIKKTTNLMLKKTGIFNYIDLIITNQDVKNPKPDPEGYELCMKIMNICKENCIIIEDSPKGIEAAIKSGAKVIKVNNVEQVDINLLKEML